MLNCKLSRWTKGIGALTVIVKEVSVETRHATSLLMMARCYRKLPVVKAQGSRKVAPSGGRI